MALALYSGTATRLGDTITVYVQGTLNKPTLYEDAAGLVLLGNPFTADLATGAYQFYADDGDVYDVVDTSAGLLPTPPAPTGPILGLTGDVTASGPGVVPATISTEAVTTAKIADGAVTEVKLGLSDVTTADVSTLAHGLMPKLPNDATLFIDGTGVWRVMPVSSSRQLWLYRANTGAIAGYPGDGKLLWDNAVQVNATALLVSHLTSDDLDVDRFLAFLATGATIIVQDQDASENAQIWTVTGPPVNTNPGTPTSYWTIPVVLSSSSGTGTTGFANNHQIFLGVFAAATGDVFATGALTDNAIMRGDGGVDHIQASPVLVEDDGRISTLTDPTDLQDAATKNYVDSQIAAVNVGGATQNSFLISGGQVVWQSGYTFLVSAATYYLNGVLLTAPQTTVVLSAADPSDDRIDVVVVNDAGAVVVVEGTASTPPSEPQIDPATQLKLSIILVETGTVQPSTQTSELLYAEDAGSPTEWDWTTSGVGFNLASVVNPRSGTKDIEGTTVANNAYAQGQIGAGTLDPNAYDFLVLYVRSKATWANKRVLVVQLQLAGVIVGASITIKTGAFGFDSSQTATYQQIAIPVTQFAIPSGSLIDQIRIRDSGGSIGFYLDDISFQGGVTSGGASGITQEQADARYALLTEPFATVGATTALPNARRLLAGTAITFDDTVAGQRTINGVGGDVVGPGVSVTGEIALFDGITGALLKRATGSGVAHVTSGVLSASNVVESEITLADNTTNDVATTKHGFAPKAPNDATQYLDGTGAYSVPSGSGAQAVLHASLNLSNADIAAMNGVATPHEIVAGIANTVLVCLHAMLVFNFSGGAYTGNTGLAIYNGTDSTTRMVSGTMTQNTTPSVSFMAMSSGQVETQASMVGAALNISSQGPVSGGGNAANSATIHIWYVKVPV